MTPLLWAAWFGHVDVLQQLVNNGANVHATNLVRHVSWRSKFIHALNCIILLELDSWVGGFGQKRAGAWVARGLASHWRLGLGRENFLNFQLKNAGFYAFYWEKLYLSPKFGTRGLIDPWGAEGVKRRGGGWKLARHGGSTRGNFWVFPCCSRRHWRHWPVPIDTVLHLSSDYSAAQTWCLMGWSA